MMLLWMAYAAGVGLLFGVAAAALDPLLRGRGLSARMLWALAMAGTLVLPVASLARPTLDEPTPGHQTPASAVVAAEGWSIVRAAASRVRSASRVLDAYVVPAWIAASMMLALAIGGGMLRLHTRIRTWPTARVAGQDVLLTDGFGPALVGSFRPRIAIPRWMLRLDSECVRLVVWHEEEHRSAGDERLLLASVVAVVVAPWNPALWWQLRRLRAAVELDCDRRVLRRGAHPVVYGSLLFGLGAGAAAAPLPVAALVPSSSLLERRLIMITRGAHRVGRTTTAALAVSAVLAVAAACVADAPVEPQVVEARAAEPVLAESGSPLADAESRRIIDLNAPGADAPLLYVDGVRIRNDLLDDLDPDRIERIEVIKGEAAETLFGAAAANGVVKIFTKPQG